MRLIFLVFAVVFAVVFKWISTDSAYLWWKIWELYIWTGYYSFLLHYKYLYPPKDGHNVSAEFHALSTSTIAHRLLFPPPADENEWLDYFQWVTDDALRVYVPINPKCSILQSSYMSSSNNKHALWIIGDKLLSDLDKYNNTNSLTILMVHGGAFVLGSGTTYHGMVCHLSNYLKMRILFIDYELAPQYVFPTPVNTVYNAYMFLLNDIEVNANNIIIHGDSAGGILTLWTLQRILKNNIKQPHGAILMSPWFDITCSTKAWMQKSTNFDAIPMRKNVYRNALWMMSNSTKILNENNIDNVSLKGLKTKFFVIIGKNEVLYEEVMDFKKICLNKFNIQWSELVIQYAMHDQAFLIGLFPEAEQTMLQIASFIHTHWLDI